MLFHFEIERSDRVVRIQRNCGVFSDWKITTEEACELLWS